MEYSSVKHGVDKLINGNVGLKEFSQEYKILVAEENGDVYYNLEKIIKEVELDRFEMNMMIDKVFE